MLKFLYIYSNLSRTKSEKFYYFIFSCKIQTVAFALRNSPFYIKFFADQLLERHGLSIFSTRTVRELLFDGYDDPLLTYLRGFPQLPINIPFTKFGWFFSRNGSSTYDGRFNMYTGTDDVKNLGLLYSWNNKHKTNFYRDNCSLVQGTSGELWPPLNASNPVTLYSSDICRSISLVPSGKYSAFNIDGVKFVGDERVFDGGVKYKSSSCYCTSSPDDCPDLPYGVQNVSDCKFGAPAFMSYPHFYLADPSYLQKIDGLSPNREEHEFSIAMEPVMGIPLQTRARLQLNLLLQKVPFLG